MSVLAFDRIWLLNARLMTRRQKPISLSEVDRNNPLAKGLIGFGMPLRMDGVFIDIISGRIGNSGSAIQSVQVVKGNVCAAYAANGLYIKGFTSGSFANAILKYANPPDGFTYASAYYLRKDYSSIGTVADYAFVPTATNMTTSYHNYTNNTGAPPNRVRQQYDGQIFYGPYGPAILSQTAFALGTSGTTATAVTFNDNALFGVTSLTVGGNESNLYFYSSNDATNDQPLLEYIAVWNRRLSAPEMIDFLNEPYQVLR